MVVVGFKHKGNPRYSLLYILFKNILLEIPAIHFFSSIISIETWNHKTEIPTTSS